MTREDLGVKATLQIQSGGEWTDIAEIKTVIAKIAPEPRHFSFEVGGSIGEKLEPGFRVQVERKGMTVSGVITGLVTCTDAGHKWVTVYCQRIEDPNQ